MVREEPTTAMGVEGELGGSRVRSQYRDGMPGACDTHPPLRKRVGGILSRSQSPTFALWGEWLQVGEALRRARAGRGMGRYGRKPQGRGMMKVVRSLQTPSWAPSVTEDLKQGDAAAFGCVLGVHPVGPGPERKAVGAEVAML